MLNKCAKFHEDSPRLNSISRVRSNFRRRPILSTTLYRNLKFVCLFVCLFILGRKLNRQNCLLKEVLREREEKEEKEKNKSN